MQPSFRACRPAARPAGHIHVHMRPARRAVACRVSEQTRNTVSMSAAHVLSRNSVDRLKDTWARITDHYRMSRQHVLDEFYTNLNRETTERLLAPDFEVYEAGDGVDGHRFSREDYLHLMHDTLLQAIPDFQWKFATTNEIDCDGYVLVTVSPIGNHTGKPFAVPGLPPIEPSGARVHMPEEPQMVKVKNGHVKEIKVLPVPGCGVLGLYTMLGGTLPDWQAKRVKSDASNAADHQAAMPVP